MLPVKRLIVNYESMMNNRILKISAFRRRNAFYTNLGGSSKRQFFYVWEISGRFDQAGILPFFSFKCVMDDHKNMTPISHFFENFWQQWSQSLWNAGRYRYF